MTRRYYSWNVRKDAEGPSASCHGGASTLSDAIENVFRMATYYQSIGAPSCPFEIVAMCAECQGWGRVARKSGRGDKVCPSCRGKESLAVVTSGLLSADPSVTLTNDCI